MNILYLCMDRGIDPSGLKGGSIHVRGLVGALTDLGHRVTIICTRVSSPEALGRELCAAVQLVAPAAWNRAVERGVRFGNRLLGRDVRRNADAVRALNNSRFLAAAAEAARELGPDLIYERYSLWGVAGVRLAHALSLPLVLEVNAPLAEEQQRYRAGLTCPPLARWAERWIWRKADLLIAVSESLDKRIQRAGVESRRIRVLPNAVDTRLFHPRYAGALVRSRMSLDDSFVIGFVGTFKQWHGVDLLLAAFRELHQSDPSTRLLLVGDGPLRPLLEEEVRKAGLEQAVIFAGSVPHQDVPHYLAAMDVALAPYPALDDFYYSPLKLFEYMAAGRPVVASRIGQVAAVVVDGVTGLLFDPGDRAGLANCVRRLRREPALRNELGKRASAACSRRTWSENAARLIGWVEPLINRKTLATVSKAEEMAGQGRAQNAGEGNLWETNDRDC